MSELFIKSKTVTVTPVSVAAVTNELSLGVLEQQKLLLPQFWGAAVWNEDADRATLHAEALEKTSSSLHLLTAAAILGTTWLVDVSPNSCRGQHVAVFSLNVGLFF